MRLGSLIDWWYSDHVLGSDNSLGRAGADFLARESQDTARPSIDSVQTPVTPVSDSKLPADGKFGSLRSILKPGNTPGTGQSVRFFSRDAYRVISPEVSSASEMEDPRALTRLQKLTAPRPTAQQVFSAPPPTPPPKETEPATPELASMMAPISPPKVGNIFEASVDQLPTIPTGFSVPLLDSAVEISDTDDQKSMSFDSVEDKDKEISALATSPTLKLGSILQPERAQSFSFGQTVFRSLGGAMAESSPVVKQPPIQRSRAFSDSFTTANNSPVKALADLRSPEADINDTAKALVAYKATEKDPFARNASTYYTPGTMLPPSPPQSTHTRTASREEDLIWSLRTQLALQSELCAQYEVDLSAKDELLEMLNFRLGDSEKELERRKNIIRNWRKRVTELEKCVKGLEEEVDRSREESAERSVMDEASGEALRMLHRRITELERENNEGDQRERDLRAQLDAANARLAKTQEELASRDQNERELEAGIKAAREEMEQMGVLDMHTPEGRERLQSMKSAWEEERAALSASNDALRYEQLTVQSQLTSLREDVVRKEKELAVLRAELEAQWKHTEQSTEDIERLRHERDALSREVDELREKLAGAGSGRDQQDNHRRELEREIEEVWSVRHELEKEREEVRMWRLLKV